MFLHVFLRVCSYVFTFVPLYDPLCIFLRLSLQLCPSCLSLYIPSCLSVCVPPFVPPCVSPCVHVSLLVFLYVSLRSLYIYPSVHVFLYVPMSLRVFFHVSFHVSPRIFLHMSVYHRRHKCCNTVFACDSYLLPGRAGLSHGRGHVIK